MLSSGFILALVDRSDRLPGLRNLRVSSVSSPAYFEQSLKLYLAGGGACNPSFSEC